MTRSKPQILKRNIAGFIDAFGIFRPIRSGNDAQGNFLGGYDGEKAGDNDNEFQRWDRQEKNQKKAEKIYEKRQLDQALEDALGDEKKVSLAQFVKRSGGLFYDPRYMNVHNGELKNLSFKQSGKRGIAHPKGKYDLDDMREAADLAGYGTRGGMPLSSVNDFLDALNHDLTGKTKIYPFGNLGAYKHNPAKPADFQKFFEGNLKIGLRFKPTVKVGKAFLPNLKEAAKKGLVTWEETGGIIYAHRLKNNMATKKTKKRTTAKTRPANKKNVGIETAAAAAVGVSAALNVFDRLTSNPKKSKSGKTTNSFAALKHNKGLSEAGKAAAERAFQSLLDRIEQGELDQQGAAKNKGKLAGYSDAEISRSIQYARLTFKLKKNPSATDLKAAGEAVLKSNGLFGRALARHKAGQLYKRQLRLEAALERTKAKKGEQEGKAKRRSVRKPIKKNPDRIAKLREKMFQASKLVAEYEGYYKSGRIKKTELDKAKKILQSSAKAYNSAKNPELTAKVRNPARRKTYNVVLRNARGAEKLETVRAITHDIAKKNAEKKHAGFICVKISEAKAASKPNPARSKSFEAFHGRPSTEVLELTTPEGAPKRRAYVLGLLLEIRLKGKPNIDFRKETTGRDYFLIADEGNKQMWIAAKGKLPIATPNSELSKGTSTPYAEMTAVIYEAEKHHLGDTKPTGYIHRLGWERSGIEKFYAFRTDRGRPTLSFDRDGCGIICNGVYTITPLGIAD